MAITPNTPKALEELEQALEGKIKPHRVRLNKKFSWLVRVSRWNHFKTTKVTISTPAGLLARRKGHDEVDR